VSRGVAAAFLAGLFLGRLASQALPSGPLGLLDLAMTAGIALLVVLGWRGWARRTIEQRRAMQTKRRRPRGGG
jgi:hypothetical protein